MNKQLTQILNSMILMVLLLTTGATHITAQTPRSSPQAPSAVQFSVHTIDDTLTNHDLHAIDIDKDNDIDIVTNDQPIAEAGKLLWYENTGGQSFTKRVIEANLSTTTAYHVSAADMNGDTEMDIVAGESGNDEFSWWENDGSENFTKHVITNTLIGCWFVETFDIDKDNHPDILNGAVSGFYWWENDGSGSFTNHLIEADFWARKVSPADLDGDSDIDIPASNDDELAWWENDGNQNFTKHSLESDSSGSNDIWLQSVDLDSDTDMDILTSFEDSDEVAWWENDGNGNFTKHTLATLDNPQALQATDVEGDGDQDILVSTNFVLDGIVWLENNGSESFTKHGIDDGPEAEVIQAVDMDGDLDPDFVIGDPVFGITWYEQLGAPIGVGKQAHYRIGGDMVLDNMSWYDLRDTAASGIPYETSLRVRFQVVNDGSAPYNWRPRLEWSGTSGSGFAAVPTSSGSAPFYVTDTSQFANGAAISTSHFGLGAGSGTAQDGVAYDTVNPPGAEIALAAGRYTEIEFNLRANSNAAQGTAYYFRLTNNGSPLDAYTAIAAIEMEPGAGSGVISGEVKDQDQTGLEGVQVAANGSLEATTESDGKYSFDIPPGTYTLTFNKSGYWEAADTAAVTDQNTTTRSAVLVSKSSCLSSDTSCALSLVSLLPVVGTASDLVQVAGAGNDLCEVGELYDKGSYSKCAVKSLLWLGSVVKIPVISQLIELVQGGQAIKCVTDRLEAVGQSLGRLALDIFDYIENNAGQETVVVFQIKGGAQARPQTSPTVSGINFTLEGTSGKTLKWENDAMGERLIEGSIAAGSDSGFAIGVVSQTLANFELTFEGTTTGAYDLDVVIPQSDGSSLMLTYAALNITPQTGGKVSVKSSVTDAQLSLDTDGDGVYDTTTGPTSITRSALRVFLPITLNKSTPSTFPAWGHDVRVDNAGSGEQAYVDMAVGPHGVVYAVWEDYRNGEYRKNGDIYFSYSKDSGLTWSADQRVNDDAAAAAGRRWPHIAVSPGGDVYVVWEDWRNDPNPTNPHETAEIQQNPDIYLAKLPAGGVSFLANVNVSSQDDVQLEPDVEVDGKGYVYVAWYDRTGDEFYGNSLVARSTNGGASFSTPVESDNHTQWALTPRLAVNRLTNAIYLVYQGHPRYYKPFFTYSTDGGASWSTDVQLDAGPNREYFDAAREIIVAANDRGNVISLWSDERNDPDNCYSGCGTEHDEFDIYGSYSTNGGVSWPTDDNVLINDNSAYKQIRYPSVAFLPDGRLVAVWTDSRTGDDIAHIYMALSSDGGASWSVNTLVDHSSVGAYRPVVVTSPSGRIYVLWQDKRYSDMDIYLTNPGTP